MKEINIHVSGSLTDTFNCDKCVYRYGKCSESLFSTRCFFANNIVRNVDYGFLVGDIMDDVLDVEILPSKKQDLEQIQTVIQKTKNAFLDRTK